MNRSTPRSKQDSISRTIPPAEAAPVWPVQKGRAGGSRWNTPRSNQRRRMQLGFFVVLVAPVLFTFGISNYFAGNLLAAALDVVTGASFLVTLLALRYFEKIWAFFRISIGLLSITLLYLILSGSHGGSTVLWLYPYALLLMHLMGSREGVIWITSMFIPTSIFLFNPEWLGTTEYELAFVVRFLLSFSLAAIFAYSIEYFRNSAEEQVLLKHQSLLEEQIKLAKAYDEIKVLSGIVPICSWCKKIRDDEGIWNQLEAYITERSDAGFSHGICPDCMEEHYPDIDPPDNTG